MSKIINLDLIEQNTLFCYDMMEIQKTIADTIFSKLFTHNRKPLTIDCHVDFLNFETFATALKEKMQSYIFTSSYTQKELLDNAAGAWANILSYTTQKIIKEIELAREKTKVFFQDFEVITNTQHANILIVNPVGKKFTKEITDYCIMSQKELKTFQTLKILETDDPKLAEKINKIKIIDLSENVDVRFFDLEFLKQFFKNLLLGQINKNQNQVSS